MTNARQGLPQTWDLTSYFPSFDGPEFRAFKSALAADLKSTLADASALFAQFQREGAVFLPRYEEFLRATGRASCEDAVRATLGWEICDPAFWSRAIGACREPVDAFEQAILARNQG